MITATVNDRTYKLGEFYRYPTLTSGVEDLEFYLDYNNKDQVNFVDLVKDNSRNTVVFEFVIDVSSMNCSGYYFVRNLNIARNHTGLMYYTLTIEPV